MRDVDLEALAAYIRSWAMLSPWEAIEPETQFERDLGITGDDGGDLLQAVQRRFQVALFCPEHGYRCTFGLGDNEYLFHSEGLPLLEYLPFTKKSHVRPFTVGELLAAIQSCPDQGRRC